MNLLALSNADDGPFIASGGIFSQPLGLVLYMPAGMPIWYAVVMVFGEGGIRGLFPDWEQRSCLRNGN